MVTRRDREFLSEGENPDPRFTLANERTFLAWIRTALALLAGGIGVEAFLDDLPGSPRRALAALLIVLGGVLALGAYRRWRAAEHAMRLGEPLPLRVDADHPHDARALVVPETRTSFGVVEMTTGCGRRCAFCQPDLNPRISVPKEQIMKAVAGNVAAGNKQI